MTRILVTGASGFLGPHVVACLRRAGHDLTAAGRTARAPGGARNVAVGEIGPQTDWTRALEGCEAVVHLAAQVPARGVPDDRYAIVNDQGTARLVRQAAASGVGTFLLMSSAFAGRTGEVSAYGRSKQAAEAHLADFAGQGRVGIAMRPPLVYGSGAKGNWPRLCRLAALPMPLPFASVTAPRSLIAVENLADAVGAVFATPAAMRVGGTFDVADPAPAGLDRILTWLREGMGRAPWLVPVPVVVLERLLRLAGLASLAESLLRGDVLDTHPFARAFGWTPPVDTETAICAAGAAYREARMR